MSKRQEPIRVRQKFSPQSKREVRRNTPLRQARTCYGHLAGVAGMALMDEMLSRQWLQEDLTPVSGNRLGYSLTPKGRQAMEMLGVPVAETAKSAGNFAFGCLDWTEPGHHLGGSLGRAVTAYLTAQGFVGRTQGIREVTLQGSPDTWLETVTSRR